MNEKVKCENCAHFSHGAEQPADTGLCTRYPPVPIAIQMGRVAAQAAIQGFVPPVHKKAWCGEFSPAPPAPSLITN